MNQYKYTHKTLKQMRYNKGQAFISNAKKVRGVKPSSNLGINLSLFAIGYIGFIYLWHLALV